MTLKAAAARPDYFQDANPNAMLLPTSSPNFKVFLLSPSGPAFFKITFKKWTQCLFLLLCYHPKDSADLVAAISRASFGDADPL